MVRGGTGGTSEPGWTLEQAFAQIQQLLGAVNTLQQTISQQEQTIVQLQAQSMVTPPVQGQVARGPKMATPPLYDGSMAQWFMQSGMAQLFCDHIMVYMASPNFHIQYLESMEQDPIELLYQDIYTAFGDPNKQAMAIQEITTIKQGTKSGEEHIQAFKQCYMRSGYGKTAGIHEFKQSLNGPLLDKIMGIPDLSTTLEKWYDIAVRLDRQWRQAVVERKIFAA
ncbi:hypothetical protein AMATHDRAFT_11124 [Amanita thiersii Skay4041]|uniref:Retrotransposon gag domain-containing protein n=1 Tax=Amanita thiersii Skay4041 TaxID=703135 RepID=A0A2A9NAF7_9AGAR|nr:hypothetical protein AMATHDRAFT_11124 [Amanita thiersii Skay4041]